MTEMFRCVLVTCFCGFVAVPVWAGEQPDGSGTNAGQAAVESVADALPASDGVEWLDDYLEGIAAARQRRRMLLIFFTGPEDDADSRRFWDETLTDPRVEANLDDYVCVRLPLNAEAEIEGNTIRLLKHRAFREMLGRPGVAIVDYRNRDDEFYGQVVSTFPLTRKLWYTPEKMAVILELPAGTLTQRTLIYAVRTHPDKPQSTDGSVNVMLTAEARSHSQHQARIRLQGHHQWGSRFAKITRLLPRGLIATEVCAESWPGESLVEAAIECVRCWRLSSGHWAKVRAPHREYGYDMRRGSNGIWYATGIFGQGG